MPLKRNDGQVHTIDIIWEYPLPEEEKDRLSDQLLEGLKETLQRFCSMPEAEMSVTLVDNKRIQELNRNYRGMDQPTDVLSFALMEEAEDEPKIIGIEDPALGDVIISIERAQEQAKENGHSLAREIVYLAIHGTLHLLGEDHEDDLKKKEMRSKEEEIMSCVRLERVE